ncbi:two-partner secretion domain-containing protein [Psychrobacter sp. T6-6]|uniref:two-partner secretion domain-containing protein n=1 Tax=Psychrobacter sp. T6-6 TaxID=3457452 RepID=UPI003FD3EDAD
MNKQCYRVVFNKARGMMMVVSEAAKSKTKAAGSDNRSRKTVATSGHQSDKSFSYHRLVLAVLCCQSMVYTQVQAANTQIQNTASNISVAQRAALLRSANGTPIVNIRTPNSKGLSHNTYNQFDIGSNGAVLNNSIGSAHTHLAGSIAGNQYLAQGVANTILNEVRSSAPATLKGNIEVAGQRADIIIASPSGLQVQGGGFINANRATLTTGTPNIDSAGNLTGFDVKQGQIQFDNAATGNALGGDLYDGKNKNKNQANYVDVLTRAVTINGQIHANQDISVASGSNTVDYDTGAAAKITGTGTRPTFAVDVSTLGGIYANSINLIGTESGLGVRNAGKIQGARQVILDNTGKIENSGELKNTAYDSYIGINATGSQGNIAHSGIVATRGMIDINADRNIDINDGIVRKYDNAGRAKYTPDILSLDAKVHVNISNGSDIRNYNASDNSNIYISSGYDTKISDKSKVVSSGGLTVNANRSSQVMGSSLLNANGAPLNLYSKSTMIIDNSQIKGLDNVNINSQAASHLYIKNKSNISSDKDLNINSLNNVYLTSGSRIVEADNLNITAGNVLSIDGSGGIEAKGNANIKAGGLAYVRNNQPINVEKSLNIEGDRALIYTSNIRGKDGVIVRTDGRDSVISNSQINSDSGAVAVLANEGKLTASNLTTDAKTTILASTDNVSISGSQLTTDNIAIESGKDLNINKLTATSKNSDQVSNASISAKGKTSITASNLTTSGTILINSDEGLDLTDSDIKAQGIILKTSIAKTEAEQLGGPNQYGDGDINLLNADLLADSKESNGLIIDAANHLNVINSKTASANSTSLRSGNLMRVNNSTLDSDKHLSLDSRDQLITNGQRGNNYSSTFIGGYIDDGMQWTGSELFHSAGETVLQADETLSINSSSDQAHQNTDFIGGAVIINSDAGITFSDNIKIGDTGINRLANNLEKLPDGTAVNTLYHDLIITSKDDLKIDPRVLNINERADIRLASREGQLYLKGYAGTQGLDSEQVVKLTAGGDINLSGKEVLIEGSDLISQTGFSGSNVALVDGKSVPTAGINITATDGSVELKGVKNSFSNYVSPYNSEPIKVQLLEVETELATYSTGIALIKREQYLSRQIPYENNRNNPNYRVLDSMKKERERIINYSAYKRALQDRNKISTLNEHLKNLTFILNNSEKASTGFEHKAVSLTGGKDIKIAAKQGVLIEGADITSNNSGISIFAEGNLAPTDRLDENGNTVGTNYDSIVITGLADIYQQGDFEDGKVTGPNYSYHQLINQPKLTAKGDIKIAAKGNRPLNTKSDGFYDNNAVVLNSVDIQSTGGNVRIDAARGDINLEASQVAFIDGSQKRTTSRTWYGKKKVKTTTKVTDNSNAVTTDISANNIHLKAESDINIYGSELHASPEGGIKATAGRELGFWKIEDRQFSETDIKKKSSWLGIRYNKDHTNDTRQEITQLPAELVGGKAYTKSGGDTVLQGTVFNTSNSDDIQVGFGKYAEADAKLILEIVQEQVTTTHNQEKESTVWMKTVDQGSVVTTASLPKFNQVPTITSPNGVTVAVPVDVTVDANNKAKTNIQKSSAELGKIALDLSKQPGYEYLATLDKTNDINWVQVDLIQKNWDYTQEGLTPGAAALIAIAITIAAGPAGSGLTASMVATNAAGIALQTQAVITLINNKGDISKTLKDMASSDTIRNMATAALTAGLTANLNIPNMTNSDFANELIQGVAKSTSNAAIESAISGTSFQDALKNNLINAFVDIGAAEVAGQIGDFNFSDIKFVDGLSRSIVHGMAGCIAGQVTSKDCSSRAMGSALGEAIGSYMAESKRQYMINDDNDVISFVPDADKPFILNTTKLITASVAALYGLDVNDAAQGSDIAVINNGMSDIRVAKANGELNKPIFSDLEARLIAATVGIVLWPVGALEAYQRADNDTDKLLILREAFGGAKARLLTEAFEANVKPASNNGASKPAQICGGDYCFAAGTLIHTIQGLKPIETINRGELVWSREEFGDKYDYRPVIATKVTPNAPIYEVKIKHNNGLEETINTTEEHPFWIDGEGWRKASILEAGMKLLDKHGRATATVVSQMSLEKTDTVYNFEVQDFSTYHIGEMGVWVHNAKCCDLASIIVKGKQANVIGTGGNKIVYAIDEKTVIGKLKSGKPLSALQDEAAKLQQLKDLGFPVVNARITTHDGAPAMIMDRYAQGSKDIVAYNNKKNGVELIANVDTSLLNAQSARQLKLIRDKMVKEKIKIDDLQFLIGKDHSVVIADPIKVYTKQKPSNKNIAMLNALIKIAEKR